MFRSPAGGWQQGALRSSAALLGCCFEVLEAQQAVPFDYLREDAGLQPAHYLLPQ